MKLSLILVIYYTFNYIYLYKLYIPWAGVDRVIDTMIYMILEGGGVPIAVPNPGADLGIL